MSERKEIKHEMPKEDREFYIGLGWAVTASVAVAAMIGLA